MDLFTVRRNLNSTSPTQPMNPRFQINDYYYNPQVFFVCYTHNSPDYLH